MEEKCKHIGRENKFGMIKVFTCLELPIVFIRKPVGEWMCKVCAKHLLDGTEDF